MSNDLALSHLFCEKHPSDAASILVRLPPEFVSGFIGTLSPLQGIVGLLEALHDKRKEEEGQ